MSLSNVRIVLVETSHPGNIGATARAMKNMFLSQLYLVRPKLFPAAEATARASGADDLLAAAVVCDSLAQAVAGCGLVIGTSARHRTIPWPELEPRQCGERIAAQADHGPAAVVFGREHSGLTNNELDHCHYHVHIPANPEFSSLNLAAAVQVITYEIMMAARAGWGLPEEAGKREAPAPAEDIEHFYVHLEQALIDIDFLDPVNPRQLMRRLRRLFNRVHLEATEISILRGILTAAQGTKWARRGTKK